MRRRRLAGAVIVLAALTAACAKPSTESGDAAEPTTAPADAAAAPAHARAARLAATLLPVAARRSDAVESGAAGSVTGRARWDGTTPLKVKLLTNATDVATCGERVNTGAMIASPDGELANVVIELRPAGDRRAGRPEPLAAAGAPPATADITRCLQEPHVLVVPLGSSVEVRNQDAILHELDGLSVRNAPFAVSLPRYRRRALVAGDELARPERIKVACRVHPWAVSWWVVTDARHHAITGRDGRFRLDGVPPGTWTLVAWHEELGELRRTVEVRAGQESATEISWR